MIKEEQLKKYAQNIIDGVRGYSLDKLRNMPLEYASIILFYYAQLVEKKNFLTYQTIAFISRDLLKAFNALKCANQEFVSKMKIYESKGQTMPPEETLKYVKIYLQYLKIAASVLQLMWSDKDNTSVDDYVNPDEILSFLMKVKKNAKTLTKYIKLVEERKIKNGR